MNDRGASLAGNATALLVLWTPVLIWMGVIFALSAQQSLPSLPDTTADLLLKKAAHALGFGVLFALVLRAIGGGAALRVRTLVLALVATAAYAAFDEFHQSLVPNRTPSAIDWGIDMAGAGAVACWRVVARKAAT